MPTTKKDKYQKILDRLWFWTKTLFFVSIIAYGTYIFGTYNPSGKATEKIKKQVESFLIEKIIALDLQEPSFEYVNEKQFVVAMHKCIDYINFTTKLEKRVPYEMIIGQASLESAWGQSRFATEGNNLFGIRTWTETTPHLLPQGVEKWPGWGVRKFKTKCASVKEYIRLLNEHYAYAEFRNLRKSMLESNKPLDSLVLIKTLNHFSTTQDYDQRVIRLIKKIRKMESE